MKILSIKRRNSLPTKVSIRADNLLFFSIALTLFLTPTALASGDPAEAIVTTVSHGAVALALGWSLVAAYSRWRLWRMRARPLPREVCPAIWGIIRNQSSKMALKMPRRIFWIPGLHRGGAWVLGGFHRKLVLTGGLCVSAERSPQIAEMIVCHELAHLDNKDTQTVAILTWIGLFCVNLFYYPVPMVLVGAMVLVIISMFLLQRREYMADARAINATLDRESYLRLIVGQSWRHNGWFHPTADERAEAMLRDSPVLRTNATMLALAFLLVLICLDAMQQIVNSPYRYQLGDVLILRLCILGVPVVAFCSELAKGFGRKIPSSIEPLDTAFYPPRDHTVETGQGLANLIGAADPVDWSRFILFLAATLALEMSYPIAYAGFRGQSPFAENLPRALVSAFEGWVWWWLPSAFFALVLFRFRRDDFDVAVGVGMAIALIFALRPSSFTRDFQHVLNDAFRTFAATWFAYVMLVLAARVRRFGWFAMAVAVLAGDLMDIVLNRPSSFETLTSPYVIGGYAVRGLVFVLVLYGGGNFLPRGEVPK